MFPQAYCVCSAILPLAISNFECLGSGANTNHYSIFAKECYRVVHRSCEDRSGVLGAEMQCALFLKPLKDFAVFFLTCIECSVLISLGVYASCSFLAKLVYCYVAHRIVQ